MLYRCYAQGPGGVASGTLLEDELAATLWGPGGLMAQMMNGEAGGADSPKEGGDEHAD